MSRPTEQIDPRDLFIKSNPTGLTAEELEKGRSGFVDYRSHSDYLIFHAGYAAGAEASQIGKNPGHRDRVDAEGGQPDLNFHLLQIAERSCSLLEDWVQLAGVRDETLTDQIKETRALLETQRPTWSVGVRDLLTERRRQVQEEGCTLERDDKYTEGQLASAASVYAFWADPRGDNLDGHLDYLNANPPACWPWGPEQWKPAHQRLMLIKAGALILAELERLDRLESRGVRNDQ